MTLEEAPDKTSGVTGSLSRNEWLVLLAIMLLAAAIRAVTISSPRIVWGDEPFYLWLGQNLWQGGGYSIFGEYAGVHFPPLFPALAGGLAPLTGGLYNASNLLYIICGALLILPLYGIARRLHGIQAARVTGLFAAMLPALTVGVLAWGTMTEPFYLLAIATAIYGLIWAMEQGSMGGYLLMAASLGLAYLTRTEAMVFALLAFLLLAVTRIVRKDPVGAVLARTGLSALLFLLIASPYVIYLQRETGRWSLSGAAGMAYVSMEGLANDDAAAFDQATWQLEPDSDEVYMFAPSSEGQGLLSALLADPARILRRLWSNSQELIQLLFSIRLVPVLLAGLAVLGLFGRAWTPQRFRGELALLASLASPLSYLPFFITDRYLAGFLIPGLIWAGAGMVVLVAWLIGTSSNLFRKDLPASWTRLLMALPLLFFLTLMLWQGRQLGTIVTHTHSFQPGHLDAAAELRERGAAGDSVVMARYPAIAFHAGTAWIPTPASTWPEVLAYARDRDADFLVMDAWEAKLRPQLSFLMLPQEAPPQLRYLTSVGCGPDDVVIYQFQESSP
ncbi:MAG: glycosyltransferase family 39 protein [Chloroflexota bacterium]|nr:glycosyltransferase family 39 protein [Chloroflexota bacterium]